MTRELTPLDAPFTEQVAAILDTYPQQDGYILKLFRVFANSVRFLSKGVINLLDKDSPLSLRDREIVILRVCANNNCEYEWGVHVAIFSQAAGPTEEQVAATRLGDHHSGCWNEEERILIQSIDELCSNGKILPDTYTRFSRIWSIEQQLEIMALCGNYHTICFVANTASLEGEAFGSKFPTR